MADDIRLEISADDSKAEPVMKRQEARLLAMERQLEAFGKSKARAANATDDFAAKAMGDVTKMATTFLGIGSIVQAASKMASLAAAEINNAVDRQKDAATANLSLPDLQRQLYANIGRKSQDLGKTARERNAAGDKMAEQLADETGIGLKDSIRLLSDAFSLREGADTSKDVYEAARDAARANPDDAEAQRALVASALGIRRGRQNITPAQAIGYVQEAGSVLPIKNTADAAKLLSRSLAATEAMGGDEKFAAAFSGSAATAAKDETGDKTANFVVNALRKLSDAGTGKKTPLEQIEAIIPRGREFAKDKLEFDRLELSSTKTPAETKRLSELKTKHAAFLSLADSGEAAFNPYIRDLLSGGDAYKNLKDNMKDVPSFAEAGPLFEENVAAANASKPARLARLKRTLEGGAEREQFANIGGAAQSITREGLAAISKAAGDSAIQQDINNAMARLDLLGPGKESEAAAVEAAAGAIKKRIKSQSETQYSYSGADGSESYSGPTVEQLEQSFRLQRTLDALLLLMQDIKGEGIKAKVKVGRDNREGPQPRAAPLQSGGGV